jgi:hypothetical protein
LRRRSVRDIAYSDGRDPDGYVGITMVGGGAIDVVVGALSS